MQVSERDEEKMIVGSEEEKECVRQATVLDFEGMVMKKRGRKCVGEV